MINLTSLQQGREEYSIGDVSESMNGTLVQKVYSGVAVMGLLEA